MTIICMHTRRNIYISVSTSILAVLNIDWSFQTFDSPLQYTNRLIHNLQMTLNFTLLNK